MRSKDITITSPNHPFWLYLAKRPGLLPSLTITVAPYKGDLDPQEEEQLWIKPLQNLSTVPDLHLSLDMAYNPPSVVMQWLQGHGHLVDKLKAALDTYEEGQLCVADFVKAASTCKSMVLNPAALPSELKAFSAFTALTHLTSLTFEHYYDMFGEDAFGTLAQLSNLQDLRCNMIADGDPYLLAKLTNLTALALTALHDMDGMYGDWDGNIAFDGFGPFSALQQLKVLQIGGYAWPVISLQGFSGLRGLRELHFICPQLTSLQGIAPSLRGLALLDARQLQSIGGIEAAASVQEIVICRSEITSLRPLASLTGLQSLTIDSGHCCWAN